MKLNKEKLDQMVEAVINQMFPTPTREIADRNQMKLDEASIRTALTPFCMEMTDDEIFQAKEKYCRGISIAESVGEIGEAYVEALKFIRDGNK